MGYLAAVTKTMGLCTGILILPQRQTVLVAKQAAEVDVLSGGRLRLGIGIGWNHVEYEALGQNFHDRGKRSEEQIALLRALWTNEAVNFEGRWHRVTHAGLNPLPVQRPIPVWLGVIGANTQKGWAPRSHLPAIVASPEFELTAVCTTRQESAEESAKKYGARLAFDDYHKMLDHPDIDAVAVVLRVPSHYEPTVAALNAGKHVYTEWPLGRTTAEAVEMADLARAKGVRTLVGLQARAAPGILYAKELVDTGYVGEVMSCHVSLIREGGLQRTSDRT